MRDSERNLNIINMRSRTSMEIHMEFQPCNLFIYDLFAFLFNSIPFKLKIIPCALSVLEELTGRERETERARARARERKWFGNILCHTKGFELLQEIG